MRRLIPVVLAGGSGTRLWPLSREDYPKQLLRLTSDNTLLQETVVRLDALARRSESRTRPLDSDLVVEAPIISCHEEHRFLTLSQLEAIDHAPERIVLEPCGRNTAPALTAVALSLSVHSSVGAEESDDPMLLVMPADHVIAELTAFHRAVTIAAGIARGPFIVTFGVSPTHPETGYGYIHAGEVIQSSGDGGDARAVSAFVEKPDPPTAESYLASGDYSWNSGIFLMRATVWLSAIARYRPDVLAACRRAVDAGTTDGRFFRVEADAFASCPGVSIDYAVMENLSYTSPSAKRLDRDDQAVSAAVVRLDAGWSDVGSWRAMLELDAADDDGNVIHGDVFTHGTKNSLLIAGNRLLATVGIENAVVVDTADATLVAHKDHAQNVRAVVDWLDASGRDEHKTHRRVYRPWGDFEQLDAGPGYQVKRLRVKPGAALSLQRHHHRAEHWVVVRGEARVTRGDQIFALHKNESTYIAVGDVHRLENPGSEILEVIEVQSGDYLGEDDIERLEDRYNRGS